MAEVKQWQTSRPCRTRSGRSEAMTDLEAFAAAPTLAPPDAATRLLEKLFDATDAAELAGGLAEQSDGDWAGDLMIALFRAGTGDVDDPVAEAARINKVAEAAIEAEVALLSAGLPVLRVVRWAQLQTTTTTSFGRDWTLRRSAGRLGHNSHAKRRLCRGQLH